jgi:hypothetical protein
MLPCNIIASHAETRDAQISAVSVLNRLDTSLFLTRTVSNRVWLNVALLYHVQLLLVSFS